MKKKKQDREGGAHPKLIHVRIYEREKLRKLCNWFSKRIERVTGTKARGDAPMATAVDFGIDLAHELVTNRDCFLASEKKIGVAFDKEVLACVNEALSILEIKDARVVSRDGRAVLIREHRGAAVPMPILENYRDGMSAQFRESLLSHNVREELVN